MNSTERESLILAYNKLKEELDKERHSETLRKYKILSKAYNLGVQIYGRNGFSVNRLSIDFDIPYTTVKRILALSKANKRTWKLIKDKKITSFKVAMCLMRKNSHYQDEIIDMVIKDNLSTYQIRSLRVKNLKDIQKERLKVAVERGFVRSHTASSSFINTIERLEELLKLKKEDLPQSKIPFIVGKLRELQSKIDKFAKEMEKWTKIINLKRTREESFQDI